MMKRKGVKEKKREQAGRKEGREESRRKEGGQEDRKAGRQEGR